LTDPTAHKRRDLPPSPRTTCPDSAYWAVGHLFCGSACRQNGVRRDKATPHVAASPPRAKGGQFDSVPADPFELESAP
jgi:hypothetical protein